MRGAKETEDAMQEETAGEIHVHPDFWGCSRRRTLRVMKKEPTTQGVHVENRGAGASSENKLGNLEKLVDRRREERRRLEREGDKIMELLKKYEEREEELEEEKHMEDKLEKWADRQRLERKGDETVEVMRRHEGKEEELKEKGKTAVEELKAVFALAKTRARAAEENTKAAAAEARTKIVAARERAAEEMMMAAGKGSSALRFGDERKESHRGNS